ncbi:MAG: peptidase [Candidatus Uhrbacteria bacterium]
MIMAFVVSISSCANKSDPVPEQDQRSEMQKKVDQFARVEIGVPDEAIPEIHRPTLAKLYITAEYLDDMFFRQVATENPEWYRQVSEDPALSATKDYFDIMYGPWDRTADNQIFWGDKAKPVGATFYPEDLTKAELEAWIEAHPDQKSAFTNYFTVIRRDDSGGLVAVPYSQEYQGDLAVLSSFLEQGADLAVDERLAKFLRSRAQAFSDNEYRQSDMDWMDLGDGDIEVVIGPVEVYEDELMNYKASFEAFIALRNPEATAELDQIKALIPQMEDYLPIPDEFKTTDRGSESPISVVDLLYSAGDARTAMQALAFNLPNDEYVRQTKGSKKVMLRNVIQAKFEQILVPIARRLMNTEQAEQVSFDAFFATILLHETGHGLGPGVIKVNRNGQTMTTTVSEELKDHYATIEEAKADTMGVYLSFFLIEQGLYPESMREQIYASFLGSSFRWLRFGASSAHARSTVVELNYLMEQGAIVHQEDGRYAYVSPLMAGAVENLLHDLLMIEAKGDYAAASAFIEMYGTVPVGLEDQLGSYTDIPIDLCPIYTLEQQVTSW